VFAAAALDHPGAAPASGQHQQPLTLQTAPSAAETIAPAAIAAPPTQPIVVSHIVDHDSDLVPQLVQAMRTQFRDGVGEAQIRLKPEHLGEVRIELKVDGDRVSAVLQVERPEVRSAIESQSHSLRSSLAAQGLNLEDITVKQSDKTADDRRSNDDQRRGHGQAQQERRSRRQSQPDREFELEAS
jgi:flagellar hook-length control protein FliK